MSHGGALDPVSQLIGTGADQVPPVLYVAVLPDDLGGQDK